MSARIKARIRQNKLILWNQYLELADAAYGVGQFGVGDKLLRAATRECADDSEMCLTLAQFFEKLARSQLVLLDSVRSERLFKKAIGMYERISGSESEEQVCRLLIQLAEISAQNNKHEVALRYFGRSLIVGKRSKTILLDERIQQMRQLGTIWSRKGRHQEALIVYNHCHRLSEKNG